MKQGDTWYLISHKWFHHWKLASDEATTVDEDVDPVGGIENDHLLHPDTGNLKPCLGEGSHYDLLHEEQWNLLLGWYGGGPAIPRKVVSKRCGLRVEVYLCRITAEYERVREEFEFSCVTTISEVKKQIAAKFDLDSLSCVLWLVDFGVRERKLDDLEYTLDEDGLEGSIQLQVAADEFELQDMDTDRPGGSGMDYSYSPLTEPSNSEISNYMGLGGSSMGHSYNAYSAPAPVPSTPMELTPKGGVTGLNNLGNTCFMNSALQCLSNTEPLSRFFLSGQFADDLNEDNPLGTGGKLATSFAHLLRNVWGGKSSAVSPHEFKTTLGKFAPQFSGYSQHDSQELLAFLLDGIHEDLNRVKKKVATETVVADGRDDEKSAREAWRRHLLRNRSVIVDHFQGQYRSELTCPDCERVSVTFDPYMYLTLQLPEEKTTYCKMTFVFADSTKAPLEVGCVVPKHGSVADVRHSLSEAVGVPASHMVIADLWDGRVYKWSKDKDKVDNIRASTDDMFAFELAGPASSKNVPTFTSQPLTNYHSYGYSYTTAPASPTPDEATLDYVHMVIYHRKRSTHGYDRDRYKCHALPMVLTFNVKETYTGKQVKDMIEERVKPCLKPTPEPEEGADGMATDEAPFEVKLLTIDVFTEGKPLADADEFKPDRSSAVAVDWSQLGLDMLADTSRVDVHPSVRGKKSGDHGSGGVQLETCLEAFTAPEVLGPQDQWYCPHCKNHVQARKKMDLWSVPGTSGTVVVADSDPEILVIHLKRFSTESSYWRDKLETLVQFPLEGLDITRYVWRKVCSVPS